MHESGSGVVPVSAGSHLVAQTYLELSLPLPQAPQYWNYRPGAANAASAHSSLDIPFLASVLQLSKLSYGPDTLVFTN